MNIPYIDVIIAVYNGEKYIEAAIASVQAQSWRNVNIIVADDGSTDQTLSIISALAKDDERIKVVPCIHKGVSATLNAGIRASTAPYIAFLDADDLWHEEKLKKQMVALAQKGEKSTICFCMVQEFENVNQIELRTHSARKEPMKGYSKISFLGNRTLFDQYGLFDESVAIGDFVDWYTRVIRGDEAIIMLDEVLAYRRIHLTNTTRFVEKNAFLSVIKAHLDEKRKTI